MAVSSTNVTIATPTTATPTTDDDKGTTAALNPFQWSKTPIAYVEIEVARIVVNAQLVDIDDCQLVVAIRVVAVSESEFVITRVHLNAALAIVVAALDVTRVATESISLSPH